MNIVVSYSPYTQQDLITLYEDEEIILSSACNMESLVLELGLYPSKSKAIAAGRVGDIPKGWTVMKGNKKTTLWIWNPSE